MKSFRIFPELNAGRTYICGIFLSTAKCRSPLGMQFELIKDEDIRASSSYDEASVGPHNGRLVSCEYNNILSAPWIHVPPPPPPPIPPSPHPDNGYWNKKCGHPQFNL